MQRSRKTARSILTRGVSGIYCAAVLACGLTSGGPAAAMTPVEAASLNAQLAMNLCLQNHEQPDVLLQEFIKAGFSYTTEDFGGGEVLHWFIAPDNTLRTAVSIQSGSLECRIGTDLWGVEGMLPFAIAAFQKLTGGVSVAPGSPDGENVLPGTPAAQVGACSGFSVFLPRTLLWVQILRQGNDGTCISDGTSVMRMMF